MNAFISSREEFEKFILQEPLVLKESAETTKGMAVPVALYFGIGLCNTHSLTQGMPADILGMMLASERIGSPKHILVADTHAKCNGFVEAEIDRIAHQQEETLYRICENLHLTNWNIRLASSIDMTQSYQEILDTISAENDYIRREIADIEWFRTNEGVRLKVGWKVNGNRDASETFFDKKYMELMSGDMSFLYTEPGRTFNPKRPRAAPYFCDDRSSRIIIEHGEDVRKKFEYAREHFGDSGIKCYRNFLKDLARLYNKTIGLSGENCLEDGLQEIVERCSI